MRRVCALAYTRILLALRPDTWRRIYADEIRCKKCVCACVRARARGTRKNPNNDNAVTVTSIRLSRASDPFYFLSVLSVPRLFARRYDRIEFKNAVSTGKYVSLKPSDSDLWTRMKSSMDRPAEENDMRISTPVGKSRQEVSVGDRFAVSRDWMSSVFINKSFILLIILTLLKVFFRILYNILFIIL